MIRIGIDANGGDYGVNSTVPAAIKATTEFKDISIVLYGDESKIKPILDNNKYDSNRISIVHTEETLSMGEKDPMKAVRKQKNASLNLAMYAAKNDEVDGVVTSGPTQCVVLASHVIIRRIPEMERVALCPIIPNFDGNARLMLDVGANVELKPEHLGQFAIYATIYAKEILGKKNPSVGYLNIGSEPGKGRELDKEVYYYLKDLEGINFYGNIEGDNVFDCPTDIILCEGYGGNICMKALEGTAKGMARMLKQEIKSSIGGKIGYLFMRKNLKRFAKRMDSSEVGGAMIIGIKKPVVKAHGNSDSYAFYNAIKQVILMIKSNINEKVISMLPKPKEEVSTDE